MGTHLFELNFKGKHYEIEADVRQYTEEYGADADGNRGVMRHCFELENQKVFTLKEGKAGESSDEMIEVTDISKEFQEAIESVAGSDLDE